MSAILIVEDERDIVSFLKPELLHEGYQVDVANDGAQALKKLAGMDLVLLDIMLPGLSGMEAVSYTHLDVYKRQVPGWS